MKPEMHLKSSLAWIILIAVSAIAIAVMFSANNGFFREFGSGLAVAPPPPPLAPPQPLLVTVNFGDGSKRAFKGERAEGMSAFSALAASSAAGHFSVRTDSAGRVVAIDDVKARNGKSWKLYVNGVLVNDVPGNIDLEAGDKIEFRYE